MSTQYLKAYRILEKIKWFGMLLSGLVVFMMMLYTCLDVFLRNVLNSTSLHTYEFSQYYFMPLAVFPALAFAYGKGVMPRINFIIEKVNTRYQRIVAIFIILIEVILFLLLSIYGAKYAISTFQDSTSFSAGGENYLLWPVIIFAPLSFFLVMVECIFLLIKNIKEDKPSFTVLERKATDL